MKQIKAHIAVSLDGHTATLDQELDCLPDEVKVIPGHGPATTIGEEKRYNPFLN